MRAIVLGDPAYFRVKSGSNPHTRNRWGLRKRVDSARARNQWSRLVGQLKDLGAQVLVLPPARECPGMVFAANAGVVLGRDEAKPFSQKVLLLSQLTPGRASEKVYYREFFERLGFEMRSAGFRFEGEADFFPAGPYYILTHGRIEVQRFRPRRGFPPFARVYGFRTDIRVLDELAPLAAPKVILPLELVDERFYHGDTALCPFGRGREFVLVYFPALAPQARSLLRDRFGDRLISLDEADARRYAANSFFLETGEGQFLLVPQGLSRALLDRIKERGVVPIEMDVSEFFEKGGGSIKCMTLDLGAVV